MSPPPYTGGSLYVFKRDLAVGDVFTERVGWRAGETPRWVSAHIISVDKVKGTMQIQLETETKTLPLRDLIVIAGPKLVAAKATPALAVHRGGRCVWAEEAVRV